jgi:hypothetical protein
MCASAPEHSTRNPITNKIDNLDVRDPENLEVLSIYRLPGMTPGPSNPFSPINNPIKIHFKGRIRIILNIRNDFTDLEII